MARSRRLYRTIWPRIFDAIGLGTISYGLYLLAPWLGVTVAGLSVILWTWQVRSSGPS